MITGQEEQYQELTKAIGGRRAPGEIVPPISRSEVLDPEALILPTDRDPLDVVLRRTEALIRDLKQDRAAPALRGFGARASNLGQALLSDTHQEALTPEEFRRVVLWLDCNSNELGAYDNVEAQRRGELVWPKLDVAFNNREKRNTK